MNLSVKQKQTDTEQTCGFQGDRGRVMDELGV